MKRLFILTICMLVVVSMFSQTVTLSFTGRGSGGAISNEIYQQIDSLQVRNITRHWEQMIYYPDTVVLLEALAVPTLNVKQSGLEQNVPNPFDCVTEARLNLFESDNVTLTVLDAGGKEYLNYNGKLSAGEHLFEITLAIPQPYFLTAVTSTGKYMVKMVNLGSCGTNSLYLKSSSDITVRSKAVVENEFDLGDQMEYLAYTTYHDIVFDASLLQVQNESEDITIHFNIPYCTFTMNVDKRYGCESYEINGETYYENTLAAATLYLTSAGGCDSVVVVDVYIDHPTETEESITACQPIYWNEIACTTSGDYIADLFSRGGCDSIVTLHFTRRDSIVHHVYESDCISATWNGETFYETGEYVRHFQTQYWCDSIVHFHFKNLTDDTTVNIYACDQFTWINGHTYYGNNNTDTVHLVNQYGCDSIVRLNLILNHTGFRRIDRLACGRFLYNDHTYTSSGVYTETLDNPYTGCDSVIELHLTVVQDTIVEIFENGCDSFVFDGRTYTESNVYDIHYHPNSYCDSIVRLHLTIGHNTYAEETVEVCDSFAWFGNKYYQSGDYEHVISWGNHDGCDSIITLHLTVNHSVTNEKTINACRQYDFFGENITQTCDRVRSYTSVHGCDSTVTYHINIFGDIETEFTQYACGSFQWLGETFNTSGNYTRHVTPVLYCDSIVTMHLFIGSPNNGVEDVQTACDSYEWEGVTYTGSGNYTRTFTNVYGCDSVVTLRLTVNRSHSNIEDVRSVCDYYDWEGDRYTQSGRYTKTLHTVAGCDSVVTLVLTVDYSSYTEFSDTSCGVYVWDGRSYSESGDHEWVYSAANGCDSVVTLHLVYHELVTDARDGNTYCTMEYGDQVWMTSNLKYRPASGYYIYGNDESNYATYGVLYTYEAALTACPSGWHLPAKAEWDSLSAYLGRNPEYICNATAANVAKSMASTEYWSTSTTTCAVGNDRALNNASGFNALPGGQRTSGFQGKLDSADWWTATSYSDGSAYRVEITKDSKKPGNSNKAKSWAFSVRCVKDVQP